GGTRLRVPARSPSCPHGRCAAWEERTMLNMTIKAKLWLLLGVFCIGLVGFGAYAYQNRSEVEVNGPLYARIAQGKDLTADIMAPPAYIIESYLVSVEMLDASPDELGKLIARSKQLRSAFETRHKFWSDSLADGPTKSLLVDASYAPAEAFF